VFPTSLEPNSTDPENSTGTLRLAEAGVGDLLFGEDETCGELSIEVTEKRTPGRLLAWDLRGVLVTSSSWRDFSSRGLGGEGCAAILGRRWDEGRIRKVENE
jgi:hypothetical protein